MEPTEQNAVIKVIGVGGGGGNAIDHMLSQQIDGVDFIVANTMCVLPPVPGELPRVPPGPRFRMLVRASLPQPLPLPLSPRIVIRPPETTF